MRKWKLKGGRHSDKDVLVNICGHLRCKKGKGSLKRLI